MRVAAAMGGRALDAGRAVGLEAYGIRRAVLPADRGIRQRQKLLHLLAAVGPDGTTPLREVLVDGLGRLRRGTTAVIVTPSLDTDWIRPLTGLRRRGVASLVCLIDPLAHDRQTRLVAALPALAAEGSEVWARDIRSIRHALAEQDIPTLVVDPVRAAGCPAGAARRARQRHASHDRDDHPHDHRAGAVARPEARLRRWLRGTPPGLASLVLLLVMLAATGLAIDEQQWMGLGPDGTSQTGMLPAAHGGCGHHRRRCSPGVGLSIGWVDLVAALMGTLAGLLFAAGAVSDAPSVVDQLRELNASLAQFLADVLVRGTRTQETSAFLLTVSALAWTSGVFAAISIFRRSHALGAIVPIGVMLMLEIVVAQRPQDIWLVIFAGASLLLVLRLDLEAQRDRWRAASDRGWAGRRWPVPAGGRRRDRRHARRVAAAGHDRQLDVGVDHLPAAGCVRGRPCRRASRTSWARPPRARRAPMATSPSDDPSATPGAPGHEVVFRADLFEGDPPLLAGRRATTQYEDRTWQPDRQHHPGHPRGQGPADVHGGRGEPRRPDDFDAVTATITSVSMEGAQLPAPQNPVSLDRGRTAPADGRGRHVPGARGAHRLPIGGQYEVTSMVPAIHGRGWR